MMRRRAVLARLATTIADDIARIELAESVDDGASMPLYRRRGERIGTP